MLCEIRAVATPRNDESGAIRGKIITIRDKIYCVIS